MKYVVLACESISVALELQGYYYIRLHNYGQNTK